MTARSCRVCDAGGRRPFTTDRQLQEHLSTQHQVMPSSASPLDQGQSFEPGVMSWGSPTLDGFLLLCRAGRSVEYASRQGYGSHLNTQSSIGATVLFYSNPDEELMLSTTDTISLSTGKN